MKLGLRELLVILVLLAVPIASWWLVFRPQNSEIAQARREIDHKREMLEKLRTATARNEDLQRANEEIKTSIDAIEARLPSNKEVDAIVRQVSELAVESGLQAPVLKSERPLAAAVYMEQPLKLQITGQFKGFYQFLLKLEQLPRITRIPQMKISRADDNEGDMKAEFTLSIYFQEEAEKR